MPENNEVRLIYVEIMNAYITRKVEGQKCINRIMLLPYGIDLLQLQPIIRLVWRGLSGS